ncbi:probable 28S ribosomal protein S6, mitochondrial [Anthonomus grandis grandis]|uniref:probable 28S ribosomal protein S6, mitochondrial n=1 Tax=Anthonomus grandis grandis TaxID=2921223 RepID=UPI0021656291|nr:probable 28S ribosomal protein S6, mitochondrial [Anthonomus grandis grandis]
MITYELMLLLRLMPKPEVKQVLRRATDHIFEKGGFIRKLENLGTRDMPYKTSVHGVVYKQASYFLCEFNLPPDHIRYVQDELGRDIDIIRRRVYKKMEPEKFDCTLHEEITPPPYRKDVQELVAEARKHDKPKFKYNTGLDYYPFQK